MPQRRSPLRWRDSLRRVLSWIFSHGVPPSGGFSDRLKPGLLTLNSDGGKSTRFKAVFPTRRQIWSQGMTAHAILVKMILYPCLRAVITLRSAAVSVNWTSVKPASWRSGSNSEIE